MPPKRTRASTAKTAKAATAATAAKAAKAAKVTKANKRQATPAIKDDTTWTSGNFEIITTDKVRFRVPDHLLFGARYVGSHTFLAGTP